MKAQINPFKFVLASFLVGIAFIVFFLIPANQGIGTGVNNSIGFWKSYGYTAPVNTITELNPDLSDLSGTMYCKLFQVSSVEKPCQERNLVDAASNFINGMMTGAYSGLVSLFDVTGRMESYFIYAGDKIGLPSSMVKILFGALSLAFLLAVILLIFYRSYFL